MYQSLFMSGENIMYLLTNTMEILQIDPHFIVKSILHPPVNIKFFEKVNLTFTKIYVLKKI